MHLRRFGGGGGMRRHGCVVTMLPNPVEPIKLKKRRSLSISPDAKKESVNKQAGCSFLKKLPVEIRILIYRQVLKSWGWSERIHILGQRFDGDKEPLSYISCRLSNDEKVEAKQLTRVADSGDPLTQQQRVNLQLIECCWRGDLHEYRQSGLDYQARRAHLSLFLTCQTMYFEAIDLLYSSFSFDLVGLPTAYRFLSLVPLHRLHRIRSLRISEVATPVAYGFPTKPPKEWYPTTEQQWIRVCSILKAAHSLRALIISFSARDPPYSAEEEAKMLALLVGIRVPKGDFLLQLPWDYERELIGRILESTCTVQRSRMIPFGGFSRRSSRHEIARPSGRRIVTGWVYGITSIIICCPCIIVYSTIVKFDEVADRKRSSRMSEN